MTPRPVRITVVGSGRCDGDTALIAERVGREVARRGGILICGGLGGVMEAAARGAREEGGITVGVLPGPDASAANPHVLIPIATDMGHARNAVNVRAADAVVAVAGGYGTLSEVALALAMGVPVVTLAPIAAAPDAITASTPEEAVAVAVARARGDAR